jgi:hypothetical protein
LAGLAAEKPDAISPEANWGGSGCAKDLTIRRMHTNGKSPIKLTALISSIDILI